VESLGGAKYVPYPDDDPVVNAESDASRVKADELTKVQSVSVLRRCLDVRALSCVSVAGDSAIALTEFIVRKILNASGKIRTRLAGPARAAWLNGVRWCSAFAFGPVSSVTPGSGHLSIIFVTVFIANRRSPCRMMNPMSVMESCYKPRAQNHVNA